MRDLLPDLLAWQQAGIPAALATVINTWGSSPRPTGSHMAVSKDGHFCGSVSGGCVESAVLETAQEVIRTGEAIRLNFGVANETAWAVGLACGGQIEVFVLRIDWEKISPLLAQIQANKPAWYSISLNQAGEMRWLSTPPAGLTPPALQETSFTNLVTPARQLVVIGGVNLAQPLVKLANDLGYDTIVVDPRSAFATPDRFPTAGQIITAWPQEAFEQIEITTGTAIAILSHDDKIDLPALEITLSSQAFYIGALGSKKTQARRKQTLIEQGLDPQSLERIKGPIGLDLGGVSAEEIALAILAEITTELHRKIE